MCKIRNTGLVYILYVLLVRGVKQNWMGKEKNVEDGDVQPEPHPRAAVTFSLDIQSANNNMSSRGRTHTHRQEKVDLLTIQEAHRIAIQTHLS